MSNRTISPRIVAVVLATGPVSGVAPMIAAAHAATRIAEAARKDQ